MDGVWQRKGFPLYASSMEICIGQTFDANFAMLGFALSTGIRRSAYSSIPQDTAKRILKDHDFFVKTEMTDIMTTFEATTDSVLSTDGTVIGYRQLGSGPGLILIHGGMQASQNFLKLSEALADSFTVCVVDRRGRGMSGTYGDHYSLSKDVEDMQAVVKKTGASLIFGLSSGAITTLQTALMTPGLQKVAIYEPPFPVDEKDAPDTWVLHFEQALAKGDLADALVSVLKRTDDSPMALLPRFVLVPIVIWGLMVTPKMQK